MKREKINGFSWAFSLAIALGIMGDRPGAAEQPSVPSGPLVEPIYRVTHEDPIGPPQKVASRLKQPIAQIPFDLTPQPGEHPLMPALRMASQTIKDIDARIADYDAVMIKRERIDGELSEQQTVYIKVRHQPFGVYMYFIKPYKGRECLYNAGPNGEKGILVAMDCPGWKRAFGKLEFDPEGHMAMKGQKYPIMKLGIREMTRELIDVANNDVKFGECEVKTYQTTINKRPVTKLQVIHPKRRTSFRFHKAEVFIDNELKIPTRYASYMWPQNPGEKPPLEEEYTYLNVNLNKGFTDLDFDKDNPELFKNE
jgi:uncharacterized protein DUF1571